MSLRIASITVDANDAAAIAGFWSEALERPVAEGGSEFFTMLQPTESSPMMMFIKVPEGKAVKNRMHLDLSSDDREAEVARLLGLGAERVHDKDEYGTRWTTLRDPEGNEFCVSEHPAAESASS